MSDFLVEFRKLQQAFPKKALPPSGLRNCFSLTNFDAESLQKEDVVRCYVTTAGYYHSMLNGKFVSLIVLSRQNTLPQDHPLCGIYIPEVPTSNCISFWSDLKAVTDHLKERLERSHGSDLMTMVRNVANRRLASLGGHHAWRIDTFHWLAYQPRLPIAMEAPAQPETVGESSSQVARMSYAPMSSETKGASSLTRDDAKSDWSGSLEGQSTVGCWKPLTVISGQWLTSLMSSTKISSRFKQNESTE